MKVRMKGRDGAPEDVTLTPDELPDVLQVWGGMGSRPVCTDGGRIVAITHWDGGRLRERQTLIPEHRVRGCGR